MIVGNQHIDHNFDHQVGHHFAGQFDNHGILILTFILDNHFERTDRRRG